MRCLRRSLFGRGVADGGREGGREHLICAFSCFAVSINEYCSNFEATEALLTVTRCFHLYAVSLVESERARARTRGLAGARVRSLEQRSRQQNVGSLPLLTELCVTACQSILAGKIFCRYEHALNVQYSRPCKRGSVRERERERERARARARGREGGREGGRAGGRESCIRNCMREYWDSS